VRFHHRIRHDCFYLNVPPPAEADRADWLRGETRLSIHDTINLSRPRHSRSDPYAGKSPEYAAVMRALQGSAMKHSFGGESACGKIRLPQTNIGAFPNRRTANKGRESLPSR